MKNSELSGIIRSEIKKQYKSINKFAKAIGMPSTSVVTILNGRAEGAAYSTIVKICQKLNINMDNSAPIVLDSEALDFVTKFNMLDAIGKHTVKTVLEAEMLRCTKEEGNAITAAFGQIAPKKEISDEERILWAAVQKIKQGENND